MQRQTTSRSSLQRVAYVRLTPGTDVRGLAQRIGDQVTARSFYAMQASFHPLTGLHLASETTQAVLKISIALGAVLIAIAALNFVNMSTAQAGRRIRETGVRKALGQNFESLLYLR